MQFVYQKRSTKQLNYTYNKRVRQGLNGFSNLQDFLLWYAEQDLVCHYCGLTEKESQEIAMTGLLKSNRFPQNGKIGQGRNRAVWLEIDRFDPRGNYSRSNCVMSCYFCNNDKSDVFSGEQYSAFFQNRVKYLRQLLKD